MQVQSLSSQLSSPGASSGTAASPLLRGSLGFIAEQLGMSQDDLEGALRKGTSLNSIAQRQGVSPSELRQSVGAHIAQMRAEQQQLAIDPSRLDQMLSRAFAQGRPAGAGGRDDPRAAYGAATATASVDEADEPAPQGISILA